MNKYIPLSVCFFSLFFTSCTKSDISAKWMQDGNNFINLQQVKTIQVLGGGHNVVNGEDFDSLIEISYNANSGDRISCQKLSVNQLIEKISTFLSNNEKLLIINPCDPPPQPQAGTVPNPIGGAPVIK